MVPRASVRQLQKNTVNLRKKNMHIGSQHTRHHFFGQQPGLGSLTRVPGINDLTLVACSSARQYCNYIITSWNLFIVDLYLTETPSCDFCSERQDLPSITHDMSSSLFFFVWRFIVFSHQLSGAAMVRRWSAYIHPRLVWGQVCGSCNRHRWEVWRTGQAGVFRMKLKEIKDE